MAKLVNRTKDTTVAHTVLVASSFFARGKGLLGKSALEKDHTLWIKPCNNIHTFFMKFEIGVIFVDKQLKVTSVRNRVKPWTPLLLDWQAKSVFEFAAGALDEKVSVGDQLDVCS
jgi:hypothetical protein